MDEIIVQPDLPGQVIPHTHNGVDSPLIDQAANGLTPVAIPVTPSQGGTGLTSLTAHNVLIGAGTSNVVLVAPSSSGTALISNGASADPSFQAIPAPTQIAETYTLGENLAANDAVAVRSGLTTDGTITQATQDASVQLFGTNWYAQTFQTDASTKSILGGSLYLGHSGSLSLTYHIFIYPTSAGAPLTSGASLVDLSISAATIGADGVVTFNFASPVAVSGSTTYALVLAYGGGDGTHYIKFFYKGSGVYANGSYYSSSNSGTSWSADTGKDFYFVINECFYTAGDIYKANTTLNNELANNFIGFVSVSGNAGDTKSVYIQGVASGFSGLTVGQIYYLTNSSGLISTTAGSQVRQAGISLSATTLLITQASTGVIATTPTFTKGTETFSLSNPGTLGTVVSSTGVSLTLPANGYVICMVQGEYGDSPATFTSTAQFSVNDGTTDNLPLSFSRAPASGAITQIPLTLTGYAGSYSAGTYTFKVRITQNGNSTGATTYAGNASYFVIL